MMNSKGMPFPTNNSDPRPLIDFHFAVFTDFAAKAWCHLYKKDYEVCAGYIQLAAQYAWFHPTGELASPELEGMLGEISKNLPGIERSPSKRSQSAPGRILHVVTEMYKVGGHTRLIWRWIQADARRRHSVVLTRQMDGPVPVQLLAAVENARGTVHYLDRSPGGILQRARELRKIAADFDHIVIHAHPWDVVPAIAFLHMPKRPSITHVNHNDHVFFLGTTTANQIAQLRSSGMLLCQSRRGIPASRCKMLPIPLGVGSTGTARLEAKRALGMPPDAVVLFTVATAYKYKTSSEHFADVLLPVVQEHPNAMLIVIGPREEGPWASATRQSGGRIRVLGKLSQVDRYYDAADIYLDSFPIASLTSSLEGGSRGVPVVSYWCHGPDAEVLSSEDPALSKVMFRGRSVEEYRSTLARLIEDAELRAESGNLTKDRIDSCHCVPGWLRYLEDLYVDVPADGDTDSAPLVERRITELDLKLARTYQVAGLSSGVKRVISDHVGMFPLRSRLEFWVKDLGLGPRALPTCLLSDGLKTRLRILGSQLAEQ